MGRVRVRSPVSRRLRCVGEGQTRQSPFGHAGTVAPEEWPLPRDAHLHRDGAAATSPVPPASMRRSPADGTPVSARRSWGATVRPGNPDHGPMNGPWWGDNPPFAGRRISHHPRPPLELDGGTTFTSRRDTRRGSRPGPRARRRPRHPHRWHLRPSRTSLRADLVDGCTSPSCPSSSVAANGSGTDWKDEDRLTSTR